MKTLKDKVQDILFDLSEPYGEIKLDETTISYITDELEFILKQHLKDDGSNNDPSFIDEEDSNIDEIPSEYQRNLDKLQIDADLVSKISEKAETIANATNRWASDSARRQYFQKMREKFQEKRGIIMIDKDGRVELSKTELTFVLNKLVDYHKDKELRSLATLKTLTHI